MHTIGSSLGVCLIASIGRLSEGSPAGDADNPTLQVITPLRRKAGRLAVGRGMGSPADRC